MSSFENAQVTLKGNILLAKALQGEKLVFTKVAMGDGYYSGAISEAEDLVNVKKLLNITKLNRKDNVAIIGALLELGSIVDEFSWRELGVYAKGEDDVEILYMYGNAGDKASYISKSGLDEKLIDINLIVGNAQNVSAIIDTSLAFITYSELENHNNDENAHQALRIWVQNQFASGDWAKYNQVGESTDDETKPTVFGVLNSLKTLINGIGAGITAFRTAYTDVRASKLDKLDVYVSSRAPADTALTKNTWTDARALNLDKLDTNVSTRARQDMLGLNTDAGGIKSQVYNENLHQKCADLLAMCSELIYKVDTMMANGLPGDYWNRTITFERASTKFDDTGSSKTLINHSGKGLSRIMLQPTYSVKYTIEVDGSVLASGTAQELGSVVQGMLSSDVNQAASSGGFLEIPYKTHISISARGSNCYIAAVSAYYYS